MRGSPAAGSFPALDVGASSTMRPELLVGEEGAEALARTRAQALDPLAPPPTRAPQALGEARSGIPGGLLSRRIRAPERRIDDHPGRYR